MTKGLLENVTRSLLSFVAYKKKERKFSHTFLLIMAGEVKGEKDSKKPCEFLLPLNLDTPNTHGDSLRVPVFHHTWLPLCGHLPFLSS